MQHEADGHQMIVEMIEERAAAGLHVERPAERMLHQPFTELFRLDLPEFLDADAEFLDGSALGQVEAGEKLLGQAAARTLGKHGVLRPKLHAGGEIILRLAVAANPHVAGGDAGDRAALVIENFGCRKARIDFDSERLCLCPEIAGDIAERADEVAMIVHQRRHQRIRQADRAGGAEHMEAVVGDFGGERPVGIFPPVGQERIETGRIDHRARQDMRADFRTLFHDDDGDFRAGLGRALLQTDRRGKTGRSRANDHHVEVHGLSGCFAQLYLLQLNERCGIKRLLQLARGIWRTLFVS